MRSNSIDLFKVAGIQIAIDYSWIVVFLLVVWSLSAGYFPHAYPGYGWGQYLVVGVVATVLLFASVITHELAHSLVANRLGQRVRRITLFIFGGMAQLSGEPNNATAEMKIAAVGPLTSLALGALFWGCTYMATATGLPQLWTGIFRYLGFINVALAVFNLLPGFPLDGGRLLRGWLWHRSGKLGTATARATDWGVGIAFALMVLGVLEILSGALIGGLWLIFIGMFLRSAAQAGYQGVVVQRALGSAQVRDLMVSNPQIMSGDLTISQAIEEHFLRHGFSGFPVGEPGRIEGLISLAQIKHCSPDQRAQCRVREIMQPADATLTVAAAASAADALRQMVTAGSGRLLVTDNGGRVIGLITLSGLIRFIQLKTELEEEAQ